MRRSLINLLSAFLVAAFLLSGLWYAYLSWRLEPRALPPEVQAAEQALASRDAVVLLHFDVATAVRAERVLLGEEDRDALRGPLSVGNPVFRRILSAGVNFRESLDHLVTSLAVTDRGVAWATILTGRFPVDQIRAALEQDNLEKSTSKGVMLVSYENLETCEATAPLSVSIAPDRIVLGTPERVARVLNRLASGTDAELDLAPWQQYRQNRLFSLAVLGSARDVGTQLDGPAARLALQAAEDGLEPIERLYLGARIATLPPRLILDARIETSQSIWPAEAAQAYEDWRSAFAARVEDRLPALARLQNHATVEADGERLVIEAALSKRFLADLAELPGEVMRLALGGLDVEGTERGAVAERTLTAAEVFTYRENMTSSELNAFDPLLHQNFKAQEQHGPFGLRVKTLRLVEREEPVVQVELEVASGAIANLELDALHQGEAEPRAQVVITAVRDEAGANLLRAEPCGPDRNAIGGTLTPVSRFVQRDNGLVPVPVVQGTKTVRLIPGATTEDLTTIEGRIELRLPTQISILRLEPPFANQVIEQAGVRLKFTDAPPDRVKYEISGKTDRVLAVRALNRQGDYLAPAGSFASERLLGPGKTVGRDFHGLPAALEVVIASGVAVAQYYFKLNILGPIFDTWNYPRPAVVRAGTKAGFEAQIRAPSPIQDCQGATAGTQVLPFRLCLDRLQTHWDNTLSASGRLMAPSSPMLAGNLSALELRIDALRPAGAGTDIPVNLSSFLDLNEQGEQLTGWFNDQLAIPELASLDDEGFEQVDGQVVLRLPKRLDRLSLDVSELGNRAQHEDGRSATLLAYHDGALELELVGPRDRLVQFLPRDRHGAPLATNAVRLDPGEVDGSWLATLRTSGRPATLEIVYAQAQDETVYDFSLTP